MSKGKDFIASPEEEFPLLSEAEVALVLGEVDDPRVSVEDDNFVIDPGIGEKIVVPKRSHVRVPPEQRAPAILPEGSPISFGSQDLSALSRALVDDGTRTVAERLEKILEEIDEQDRNVQ